MGTPCDSHKFKKLVIDETKPQLDPIGENISQKSKPTSPSGTNLTQASNTASSSMGVISRLPQLTTVPTPDHSVHYTGTCQQQSTIDEYFTQSKYYSEDLPVLFPVTSALEQPGPSGLQTPKTTKPSSSLAKVRKRKLEHGTIKKSYKCPTCHRIFSSLDKVNKHHQGHTGSSAFKCEHCKKTFTSKFKLVRHALIHSDRKPFSCTVCERTFHRKDHLKNHIKVHSPSKKTYVCEHLDCKKQYTSLLSYRKHLAIHSAEDGNLTCQICSVSFQSKDEILYHLKIHAGSRTVKNPNEKKFTCDYCDRRFFTKKDVRRHLVVHTGMRDFLCQFCPQRFGRKDHLVRHIKKSHNTKFFEKASTVVKPEQPKTSGLKKQTHGVVSEIKTEVTPVPEQEYHGDIDFSLEHVKTIFEDKSLASFAAEELFLSSSATRGELEELGSEILEEIQEEATVSSPFEHDARVVDETVVLNDPQMLRLLEPSEEKNLPLPGFSQTFQPPPPPKS